MAVNQHHIAVLELKVRQLEVALAQARLTDKAPINAKLRPARMVLARARGSHTTAQWQALVAETQGMCVRCHKQHDLNVEQPCKGFIQPVAGGGNADISNLMPLCRRCASARGSEAIDWLADWRRQNAAGKIGSKPLELPEGA